MKPSFFTYFTSALGTITISTWCITFFTGPITLTGLTAFLLLPLTLILSLLYALTRTQMNKTNTPLPMDHPDAIPTATMKSFLHQRPEFKNTDAALQYHACRAWQQGPSNLPD